MPQIRCTRCSLPFDMKLFHYRCPDCGGIYDFDGPPLFNPSLIQSHLPGIWQYQSTFDLPDNSPVVSLGEGQTPFIWANYKSTPIGLKLESLNPTGSYKDRGSAVLASWLVSQGYMRAVEDSSGNAGASFAAYAARAGISARVFVPESASGPKRVQIEKYGADLVSVQGARSAAAEAVLNEVAQGAIYASHAFLPFGLMGIATIAYELMQDLEKTAPSHGKHQLSKGKYVPGTVVVPVGHGGLLLGLIRGFSALRNVGVIQGLPAFIAVQAASCAPVVAAGIDGLSSMNSIIEGPTLAEGVRVRNPARVEALIREMEPGKRGFVKISENQLKQAHRDLAYQGIQVEPTSALVWAAVDQVVEKYPGPIVLILTGSGLKYQPKS